MAPILMFNLLPSFCVRFPFNLDSEKDNIDQMNTEASASSICLHPQAKNGVQMKRKRIVEPMEKRVLFDQDRNKQEFLHIGLSVYKNMDLVYQLHVRVHK